MDSINEMPGWNNPSYYPNWISIVNGLITKKIGLQVDDLPDGEWRAWFDSGLTPQEALEAWAEEFEDEFGDSLEALFD